SSAGRSRPVAGRTSPLWSLTSCPGVRESAQRTPPEVVWRPQRSPTPCSRERRFPCGCGADMAENSEEETEGEETIILTRRDRRRAGAASADSAVSAAAATD